MYVNISEEHTPCLFSAEVGRVKMQLCRISILIMVIMHSFQPYCYPEDGGSIFLRNILKKPVLHYVEIKKKYWKLK